MDCADRISMQGAELDLRRVRGLREAGTDEAEAGAVELLVFSRRRRFAVTIRAGGGDDRPAFGWSAVEVAADGAPLPDGARLPRPGPAPGAEPDPEEAYWAAVEAIAELEEAPEPAGAPVAAGARGATAGQDGDSGSSWRSSSTGANRSPRSSTRARASAASKYSGRWARERLPRSTSSQSSGVETVGRSRPRSE